MDSTRTAIEGPTQARPKNDPPEREKQDQDRKADDRPAIVARLATLPGVVIASAMRTIATPSQAKV